MEKVDIKKKSQVDPEDYTEQRGKAEDYKKKDIPLEKMRKAELLRKTKKTQELAEKNFDLYIRSQAEMDNMKKRFQKEKNDLIKFSNESLIKQLLPVIDNLEKAVVHAKENESHQALMEGVDLTLKGLIDVLEKAGLEKIEAAGKPFDPNFHEAISRHEDITVEPGTVVQELQKGYSLNNRLIRPTLVIISKMTEKTMENEQK